VLLAVISLPAAAIVISRSFSTTSELNSSENNPDKFYLWTTGKGYSFRFTYNPHAADAWMFKTAEGHLQNTNQVLNITLAPGGGAR
jgi:hypothetical protein